MRARNRRRLASGLSGLTAVLSFGCAVYEARPLPPAADLADRGAPNLARLKVAANELHHPLISPVTLDLADGLSPDEAAALTVLANPDLIAARDAHGETAAQLVAAGLLPNPSLSVELAHPYGSAAQDTVNAYNAGLGTDVASLIGRAARVAGASKTLAAVDLGIAWQEWQTAQAARLAVTRLAMLDRRLEIVRSEINVAASTAQVVAEAGEQGDATALDVGGSRSSLAALRRIEGTLSRSHARAHSRLTLLLGLPPETRLKAVLPGSYGTFPPLPGVAELAVKAAVGRLDLRALELGYQAQEARVRQAVLAQFPAISIGVAAQRNETNIRFLGGFISLAIPVFNRNQATIAKERATRSRLEHEYGAREAAIRAEVGRLLDDDRLLERMIASARRGIASLSGIESAAREGVATGDLDRLAWQKIRSEVFDLELQEASLLQARLEDRIALETAVGGSIRSSSKEEAP